MLVGDDTRSALRDGNDKTSPGWSMLFSVDSRRRPAHVDRPRCPATADRYAGKQGAAGGVDQRPAVATAAVTVTEVLLAGGGGEGSLSRKFPTRSPLHQ